MRINEMSANKPKRLERLTWMVVHEYLPVRTHGVIPSEYDVREVDEKL